MSVKEVSYKKEGNKKLSEHISLKELKCKDGTDTIKYCTETIDMVERIIKLTGSNAVIITSGYRTPSYNKKIGGASKSSHTEGYALDVSFRNGKYSVKEICCIAQDIGVKGIGYISNNAVHLDMKGRTYRGDERKDYSNNVGNDFYTYFGIKKGSLPTSSSPESVDTSKLPTIKRKNSAKYVMYVRQMQQKLKDKGFKGANGKALSIDGKWGDNTDYALYNFQKANKLIADKICGKNTWKKLYQ